MRDFRLRKGEYTLGEAVQKMLETYKLSERVSLSMLRTHWQEIAGDTIHKYTSDLYLRRTTLYVKVSNPALKQELNFMKHTLIEAVNSYFKKKVVDELVIN
jgi:predicted nucleic acid-binding Zn ribbon protein